MNVCYVYANKTQKSGKIFLMRASSMSLAVTVASMLYGSSVFKENTKMHIRVNPSEKYGCCQRL